METDFPYKKTFNFSMLHYFCKKYSKITFKKLIMKKR